MSLCDEAVFRSSQVLPYVGPFSPYRAADKEVEDLLLFTPRRETLWMNFLRWRTEAKQLFGDAVFWINGSFVTVKPDPHDVDVVVIVPVASYRQAYLHDRSKILSLKTITRMDRDGSKTRIQPYGGLIDSFIVPCDNISTDNPSLRYWDDYWSTVNTAKHSLNTSLSRKGFLEVR